MKSFFCTCFALALLISLALADAAEKSAQKPASNAKASDKSSDSKPKRDASLLLGSGYHGPSYKYLPPSTASSVYDSYGGAHHGLGSSYAGLSSAGQHHHRSHHGLQKYSGHSLGHHSPYSGYSVLSGLSGGKLSGISHGSSIPVLSAGHAHTSSLGHHGYAPAAHQYLQSSGHSHGHGHGHGSLGPVYTAGHGVLSGGAPSYSSSSHGISSAGSGLSHGGHVGHAPGHAYITSASLGGGAGLGHKVISSHANVPSYSVNAAQVGTAAGLAAGYHYSKGISGSLPGSLHSAGSGAIGIGSFANHGFADSGISNNELHHSDHVHNGNQEQHHYIVTTGHDVNAQGLAGSDGYHYDVPAATYLTPATQQHAVQPSNSYGVPLTSSYANHGNGEDSPIYAAGHKGLGHFSYTSSKPNVLHTSFIDSSFKTPTYSNAPFKPSTFLGTKYEGGSAYAGEAPAVGHSPAPQYVPPSGVGAESTGYDYPIPTVGTFQYRDTGYQTSGDNATPIHESESTYLPPNNLDASYNEVSHSGGQTYGSPH